MSFKKKTLIKNIFTYTEFGTLIQAIRFLSVLFTRYWQEYISGLMQCVLKCLFTSREVTKFTLGRTVIPVSGYVSGKTIFISNH